MWLRSHDGGEKSTFQEPAEPASGMTSSSAAAVDVDPAQGFMRLPLVSGEDWLECGEEILIGWGWPCLSCMSPSER